VGPKIKVKTWAFALSFFVSSVASATDGSCVNLRLFEKMHPEIVEVRKNAVTDIRKAMLDRTQRPRADLEIGNHLADVLIALEKAHASPDLIRLNFQEIHRDLNLSSPYEEWVVTTSERVAQFASENSQFKTMSETAVSKYLRRSKDLLDVSVLSSEQVKTFYKRLLKAADRPTGSDRMPLDYTLRLEIAQVGVDILQQRNAWREMYDFGDEIVSVAVRVEGSNGQGGHSKTLTSMGESARGKAASHLGPYARRRPFGTTPESISVGASKAIIEWAEVGKRDPLAAFGEKCADIFTDLDFHGIQDPKARLKAFELTIEELKKNPKFKESFRNLAPSNLLAAAAEASLKAYPDYYNNLQRGGMNGYGVGPITDQHLTLGKNLFELFKAYKLPRDYEANLLIKVAQEFNSTFRTAGGNQRTIDDRAALKITQEVLKVDGKEVDSQSDSELVMTEKIAEVFTRMPSFSEERGISTWGEARRHAEMVKNRIEVVRRLRSEHRSALDGFAKKWIVEKQRDPNLKRTGPWEDGLSYDFWEAHPIPDVTTSTCDEIWTFAMKNEQAAHQIAFQINSGYGNRYMGESKMRNAMELSTKAYQLLRTHPDYKVWSEKRAQETQKQSSN